MEQEGEEEEEVEVPLPPPATLAKLSGRLVPVTAGDRKIMQWYLSPTKKQKK